MSSTAATRDQSRSSGATRTAVTPRARGYEVIKRILRGTETILWR